LDRVWGYGGALPGMTAAFGGIQTFERGVKKGKHMVDGIPVEIAKLWRAEFSSCQFP